MSVIAIMLGVAFVAGSLTFTDMLKRSFESIASSTYADVNVIINTSKGISSEPQGPGRPIENITDTDLDVFRQVEGVERVEGSIGDIGIYTVGKDGKAIASFGPPGFGFSYISSPAFNRQPGIVIDSGRAPEKDSEVMIDTTTFKKSGYQIGDEIKIVTGTGTLPKTLVGTAKWGTGGTSGASYVFFTMTEARRIIMPGKTEGYQSAWITVEEGVDVNQVRDEIAKIAPEGYDVITGIDGSKDTLKQIEPMLGFVNTFFLVFAGISLVIAAFLIVNTFSIVVTQRRKELALYRALGASKNQIRLSVVGEALVMGLIGSLVGLLLGLLLAAGIVAVIGVMGMDLGSAVPRVTPTAVAVSIAIGLIVTLLSSLAPANKAAEVEPVIVMTDQGETAEKSIKVRLIIGVVLVALGAGFFIAGLVGVSNDVLVVGIGALMILVGIAITSPILGRPIIWALGKLYRTMFGEVGKLAELNTTRQPRRTAATATSLMIGLALVSTLAVVGTSAKASMAPLLESSIKTDYILTANNYTYAPAEVLENIQKLDSVEKAAGMSSEIVVLGEDDYYPLIGLNSEDVGQAVVQTITEGRVFENGKHEIIVLESLAQDKGIHIGDQITMTGTSRGIKITFTVVGFYKMPDGLNFGLFQTDLSALLDFGVPERHELIGVDLKDGYTMEQLRQDLTEITKDYPLLSISDRDEYAASQQAMVDSMLNIIYALLGLAVVIAVLGIVNTLGLSVLERTKEIGLLRAVGFTRRDIRNMVTLESVAIAILGAILGLSLGVLFGYGIQQVTADDGMGVFSIPWALLIGAVVAAILVGILAAVMPSRRAARTDVLEAIAAE